MGIQHCLYGKKRPFSHITPMLVYATNINPNAELINLANDYGVSVFVNRKETVFDTPEFGVYKLKTYWTDGKKYSIFRDARILIDTAYKEEE